MKKESEKYVKLGVTIIVVVAVCLLIFFIMFRMSAIAGALGVVKDILSPFLYGAVIAYILAPICSRLERWLQGAMPKRRRLSGTLAILLSVLFALLLVAALFVLVIPQVVESVVGIAAVLPGQIENAVDWFHDFLESQPDLQAWWDSFSADVTTRLEDWMRTDLLPTAQNVLSGLGVQVVGFIGVVKNLVLGLLISVYMLAGRKRFARQARMLLCGVFPKKWADTVEEEVRYADRMFNGFLMGKLLDSAIIGIICFVVTSILRFEAAALISVIVGVTNIIPFFGPFIGAVPCALLLLLKDPIQCLIFLVFIVILQQLDGNVIGPKILGNTTGLSSFWVLFAILLFGGLWGIFGMIVGVPLFAVIYDIVRKLVGLGLRRHSRDDLLPPPSGPDT